MGKTVKVESSEYKTLEDSPGESLLITGKGEGGKSQQSEMYTLPGFLSRPQKDENLIIERVGEQRIIVGSKNYSIKKQLDKGEVSIFSYLQDGTIKGEIYVKKDGLIELKNELESMKTLMNDLIDAVSGIVTTGSPVIHTVSGASQAALNAVKARFDQLFG